MVAGPLTRLLSIRSASMPPRKTKEFSINEIDESHIWLELREGSRKRGLQFAVPKDVGAGEQLSALDEETKVSATLVSINERNTAWHCVDFECLDPAPS